MILKAQNRNTRTKTCANGKFPKPQTRKLANNRKPYSSTLFLKLKRIYVYIYSLSSYLAEDSDSVRKTKRRIMYMEIVSVTFENTHKHINAMRGQKMYSS